MTTTGMAYILQCADMEYYEESKEYCDESKECEVSYCTEPLCN